MCDRMRREFIYVNVTRTEGEVASPQFTRCYSTKQHDVNKFK